MRRLGIASLPAALIFRALRRRVIFFEPTGVLRSPKSVTWLQSLGLEWVDFHKYTGFHVNSDLTVATDYASALARNEFFKTGLNYLSATQPGLHGREQTARALLFDKIVNSFLPSATPYSLAEHFRRKGVTADVFQPRTPTDTLLTALSVTKVRNFFPLSASFLVWAFFKIILRKLATLRPLATSEKAPAAQAREPAAPLATVATADSPVILFPHKGLSYSNLFSKDQYFSPDHESPFHPSNLQYIELNWTLSGEQREKIQADYASKGMTAVLLDLPGHSISKMLGIVVGHFRRAPGGLDAWMRAAILGQIEIQLESYREAFRHLRHVRVALIDSDNLFPRPGIVALQSLGIKVVSLQERFMSAFHRTFVPIFDCLFVHGEFVKQRIAANPFAAVDKIVVAGDPRASKIENYRAIAQDERERRFSAFRHVCLALDFHSVTDQYENALIYGPDWQSNLHFYAAVAELAEENRDCAFVIRGKNIDWLELPQMAGILERISSLKNVFVDDVYDRLDRSYELAAMADLVVARYTSLCDQCLAQGIPVLIFDALPNGERIISGFWDYRPYPVMAYSALELHEGFERVIRQQNFMEPGQFRKMRQEYYNSGEVAPQVALQAELESLLSDKSVSSKLDGRARSQRPRDPSLQ